VRFFAHLSDRGAADLQRPRDAPLADALGERAQDRLLRLRRHDARIGLRGEGLVTHKTPAPRRAPAVSAVLDHALRLAAMRAGNRNHAPLYCQRSKLHSLCTPSMLLGEGHIWCLGSH